MATENVLSVTRADLSAIENDLGILNTNVSAVHGNLLVVHERVGEIDAQVIDLHSKQDDLRKEIERFSNAFYDYIGEYRRNHNLQMAQTEIISVKQDLEQKFGYYAEIRRMTTGILQGVDNRLVTNDTLQYATEEAMIKAPGYWLAPTLVCVASWLRDDKLTSERAVKESIRRDDYRTSLFFTLMCRRLGRDEAVLKWIDRYFQHQNPQNLDREFILILESVSIGVFPPASHGVMIRFVKDWVTQLTQTDDYINEQKVSWSKFFYSKKDSESQSQYEILKNFATNWTELEQCLQHAKANQHIGAHFNLILSSGSQFSHSHVKELDKLLNSLVTDFDDEELPLRKKYRECELIIEKKGDKDAALSIMDAEDKVFAEKVDLLQLLSNAAFNPEITGASKATQALAVSISQPWILESFNTFVNEYRVATPIEVEFEINGWRETTRDGKDEQELLYKQKTYYEQKKDEEIANAKFPWNKMTIPGFILLVSIALAFKGSLLFGLLGILLSAFLSFRVWKQNEDYKNGIDARIEEEREMASQILRKLLIEVVDYRGEMQKEDNESEKVFDFLNNINSDSFMSLSKGAARSIIK